MIAVTVRAFVDTTWLVCFGEARVDEPQGMLGVCFTSKTALAVAHFAFFFRGAE